MKPLSETYKELGIGFTFPIEIWDANDRVTYFEDCDDSVMTTGRGTSVTPRVVLLTTRTAIATGRSGSVMQMEAWITMKTAQV